MIASETASWVQANPHGAQVIIPGSIRVKAIEQIRKVPQLVGWTETPEESEKWGCVCSACLPPGLPDLNRRLKGAFDRAVAALRQASTDNERYQALQQMEEPARRSRGRLSAKRLLSLSKSQHPVLRAELARLLGTFPRNQVEATLIALARDPDEMVRESAFHGLWESLGAIRAATLLADHPEAISYLDSLED